MANSPRSETDAGSSFRSLTRRGMLKWASGVSAGLAGLAPALLPELAYAKAGSPSGGASGLNPIDRLDIQSHAVVNESQPQVFDALRQQKDVASLRALGAQH